MDRIKLRTRGLNSVNEWKQRVEFAEEFDQIAKLQPQPRGRKFQTLLAKVIKKFGWLEDEGARTSHEEMDIIIHKDREYFLVECKWEKDPIEADVVRELYGKLSNRIGVQGILASMSGFSKGAINQAEKYASSRVIIFFGQEDIENMFYGRTSFNTLLNEKYQELITHTKIIYN